jgi:cellobiose-specific phosphotransferase system component IIA
MLAFIVPLEKRSRMYQVIGFAKDGRTYESGVLISHSDKTNTRVRPAAKVDNNRIEWRANTGRYLTSFILVHSGDHVHAAGYSQRMNWRYPDIRFFPHIVIPPDGTDLGQPGVSIMIMVVDKDAWVPEILVWGDVLKTES